MWQRIKCRWFNRHTVLWYTNLTGDQQSLACMHCKQVFLRRNLVLTTGTWQDAPDHVEPEKPTVH
jgi:hypothetical protein